jgi:lactoylglutathione lyase
MPAVNGAFHAGITVSDIDASLAFYRGGLGLDVVRDVVVREDYLREVVGVDAPEVRAVYLAIPGSELLVELLQYKGVPALRSRPEPSDIPTGHLALWVDDLARLFADLADRGYAARSAEPVLVTSGANRGRLVAYVPDPDGYFIELVQKGNL